MDIKSIKEYIEHREQSTKAKLDNASCASCDSWKLTYQIVLNELAGIKNLIENIERIDKAMGVK